MSGWLELLTQPVALFAWALLALLWVARRPVVPGAVRRIVAALIVVYFAAATPLGANTVVGALEGGAARGDEACLAPGRGRVVVALAGGVTGRPASADDVGSLHVSTVRRVLEALKVARAAPEAPVVLSGGSGDAVREADLMASLARALGFPSARLLLERDSATTAEAAANVARLLPRGPEPAPVVHLVTSAMHMPRAAAAFRRQGLTVCPVPVDRRLVRPAPVEALIPQLTALDKSTAAYHEVVGYAVYWATGRL